ncbi:MAG: GatB/YqeY domain-containing protein [Planctomycetota bacterium]|nr:MAG: GatB/YqeY domain-containing protein [Planctomycetota bacterium]
MLDRLSADLKEAMKARDETRMLVLRSMLTELKNERVKKMKDLGEDEALAVLQRCAKQRKDSIEQYKAGGRRDLVEKEAAELKIIETYLPEQMSDEEVEALVKKTIEEVGAIGRRDMGRVMKPVMEKCRGRVDGAKVRDIVNKHLE